MTDEVVDDETEFLNVDLEVFSRESLAVFAKGLGPSVHVLHEGRWGRKYAACLETWSSGSGQSPDILIRRMVRLLEKMPRASKMLWNRAQVRQFNIGIRSGFRPRSFELPLKAATVKAIGRLGAQLLITVYAADEPRGPGKRGVPPNDEMQLAKPAQTTERRR